VRRRKGSSFRAAAIFLTSAIFLGGCVSVPYDPGRSEPVRSVEHREAVSPVVSMESERLQTAAGSFGVTTVKLDPGSRAVLATGWIDLPEEAVVVMTTPWRRATAVEAAETDGVWGRRIPVGIVRDGNRELNPAEPPYWALRFSGTVAGAEAVPQTEEAGSGRGRAGTGRAGPSRDDLVLGGFYPLVLEGVSVASRFPGGSIRAGRVVFAVDPTGTPTVITVEGSGLFRRGPTTEELAEWLVVQGYQWALNLDGGRSSAVVLPDGTLLPEGITFRRAGPVGVAVFVIP
jgi:hypothetical protein